MTKSPDVIQVLVSAYSCRPGAVSEPGVAWRQLEALASDSRFRFTVITRLKNVSPIEDEVRRKSIDNLTVVGVDLPRWARFWKRGHLTMHLYYGLWQLAAWQRARALCRGQKFHVAHHLSFMSVRTCFVPFLDIHSIVGPVGGAQVAPAGFGEVLLHPGKERLRTWMIRLLSISPWWRLGLRRVGRYVLANHDNLWVIPEGSRSRCVVQQIGWQVPKSPDGAAPATPRDRPVNVLTLYWGGRLIGWKGLELLLRAIPLARAEGVLVRLDITGKGPDEKHLRQVSTECGLDDCVAFHGYLPFAEVEAMQRSADLIVFTSLH